MTFIYTRQSVVTPLYCKKVVEDLSTDTFFQEKKRKVERDTLEGVKIKRSTDMNLDLHIDTSIEDNKKWWILDNLRRALYDNVVAYCDRFHLGLNIDNIEPSQLAVYQHYKPGEGYPIYHCENNGSFVNNRRVLAWMLYLNDVNYGGETEFLYQNHFEKAEAGKIVIWPAGFTHTHRGVISGGEDKHIFTGWFEYKLPEMELNKVQAIDPVKVE